MYIVECVTTTVGHHMDAMARHEYDYLTKEVMRLQNSGLTVTSNDAMN